MQKSADVALQVDPEENVTAEVLEGWLKRARRKFSKGVLVIKVTSQGKPVRRTVFVGAKAEYFEITSAKLFDVGYHMLDIQSVTSGSDSPDFDVFRSVQVDQKANAEQSCVVRVESRPISLVFKTAADRRDFVFLMRVGMIQAENKYAALSRSIMRNEQATL